MEKSSIIKWAMEQISTIKSLLALWPSRRVIADDTGASLDAVNKWPVQNSIPARFHAALLDSAERNAIPLTAGLLAQLHDHRALPAPDSEEDAA
jgi:hypothetical protein